MPRDGILRASAFGDGPFQEIGSSKGSGINRDSGKIVPLILAADFARLGPQVGDAERAGADGIHIDVMDGHFVPNISMGAPIIASLRQVTRPPLETHLMISDPDAFIQEFVDAGSDSLLVHWEGNLNLHRTVQSISPLGKRAGVAINPATLAAVLEEILPEIDQVFFMTVDRGFGHQQFLYITLPKIRSVRQMIDRLNPGVTWRWTEASIPRQAGWRSRRKRTF